MPFVQNFPFFSIMLPIVCAIVCLGLPAREAHRLTLASAAACTALSCGVLVYTAGSGGAFVYQMGHFPAPFGNELRAGALEALLATVFCAVTLLSVLGGAPDFRHEIPEKKRPLFCVMLGAALAGMLAVIYTNDLFTAYVFIEIITIAACSLIACKPGGRTLAATAGYLIMSLLGSSLLLLAIALLYGVTGHLLMPSLGEAVAALEAAGDYRLPLLVSAGLLTVGLAIKSALFPFHVWLPDAHASATTTASSVLSGLIVKCYPVLMIKLLVRVLGLDHDVARYVTGAMLLLGIPGLLFGSWMAARQRNIKRMLSYASVAQIGFIYTCIGLGGTGGLAAACFHIVAHALAKSMLFSAAGSLSAARDHRKELAALRGTGRRDPVAGAAFLCGALSMIGIPPFSAFFSKLYLAGAGFGTVAGVAAILAAVVVGTVLSVMYYIPAVTCLFATG